MNYSKYIHDHIRVEKIKTLSIPLKDIEGKIKAQYNPNRFEIYASCTSYKSFDTSLNILYSPHFNFLATYMMFDLERAMKTPYIEMYKKYGRDINWINQKALKFIHMYENYKQIENPSILEKPIIENPYNDGYEVWEGHHRLAICLVKGFPTIIVDLYKWKKI